MESCANPSLAGIPGYSEINSESCELSFFASSLWGKISGATRHVSKSGAQPNREGIRERLGRTRKTYCGAVSH